MEVMLITILIVSVIILGIGLRMAYTSTKDLVSINNKLKSAEAKEKTKRNAPELVP